MHYAGERYEHFASGEIIKISSVFYLLKLLFSLEKNIYSLKSLNNLSFKWLLCPPKIENFPPLSYFILKQNDRVPTEI